MRHKSVQPDTYMSLYVINLLSLGQADLFYLLYNSLRCNFLKESGVRRMRANAKEIPATGQPVGLYKVLPVEMLNRNEAARAAQAQKNAEIVANGLSGEQKIVYLQRKASEEATRAASWLNLMAQREKSKT